MFVQCKITFFFFNDTATTEIYTLSLHDALPIWASALIGNFLKIIPILTVENGKTSVLTKVRTKGKAIKTMVDKMLSDIENYGLGEILVHHINCYNEAEELVKLIKEHIDINISKIGRAHV